MDSTNEIGLPLFLILCGILGMLLLAIAVIVFFLVYQKRLFAQKENIQNLESEYQRNLLEYSVESQEAERKRIAYDLHDDVGSLLSTIRIYTHQLTQDLPKVGYAEIKNESTQMIDRAIDHIRNISHSLYPPNLEHLGLIKTCEDLCQSIRRMEGLDIEFVYNNVPVFTKKEELCIYRILQELTKNTIKHSNATKLYLSLGYTSRGFEMIFKDNGLGFDFEKKRKQSNGMGLKSIESRAISINASIKFNSNIESGLVFSLNLKNMEH